MNKWTVGLDMKLIPAEQRIVEQKDQRASGTMAFRKMAMVKTALGKMAGWVNGTG